MTIANDSNQIESNNVSTAIMNQSLDADLSVNQKDEESIRRAS